VATDLNSSPMETATPLTYRTAGPRDLRKIHAAYRECFDEVQRIRTVAHSPFLFRYFHNREMRAGRCTIAVASDGEAVVGFCIVRQQGDRPDGRWLLSAIGVVPNRRGSDAARHLFEMVATRPLTLTVEEGGPVGFYERLGMHRAGARTLVYFQKRNVAGLAKLTNSPSPSGGATSIGALHWSAFLVKAEAVTPKLILRARKRLRFQATGILELPGRLEVPPGLFDTVVHEIVFEKP
jgi:ribosomal protein S18 acetylase RimI-like enzyme